MAADGEPVGGARRLLAAAVANPTGLDDDALDRTVDLLGGGDRRDRVAAAWVLGLLASEAPERATKAIPGVAAALADPETRPEAERALAYMGRHDLSDVDAVLAELPTDSTVERCREALSEGTALETVVPVAGSADESDKGGPGASGGGAGGDGWGWVDRAVEVYDSAAGRNRGRPPTDEPLEPPSADVDLSDFESVSTLAQGDGYVVKKATFLTDGEVLNPATLVAFERTEAVDGSFLESFDYRMAVWDAMSDDSGVVPLIAWGTEPTPWLATEHVLAGDVTGLGRVATLETAGWTLLRIADVLRRAHHRGVTHGGLVPGSVALTTVLSEPDAWAVPRVTHWGMLELLRRGTPKRPPLACLAPEYRQSGRVDDATDVYQFGVTAYATLTGELPETGPPTRDDRQVDARLPRVSTANPSVPVSVDEVLSKCLAERRTRRYGTVDAMYAELRRALEVD